MGYCHYFYLIKKEEAEKVRDMSFQELLEYSKVHYSDVFEDYDDNGEPDLYFHFTDILNQKKIHDFGKLYFEDTAERVYSKGEPFFRKKETQEDFGEYAPYIMGKEGMLEAIECYRDRVICYYKKTLKVLKGEPLKYDHLYYTPKEDVESKIKEWSSKRFIDTKLDSIELTHSWSREYAIFNLLHLYKTIDWDDNALLFYGY